MLHGDYGGIFPHSRPPVSLGSSKGSWVGGGGAPCKARSNKSGAINKLFA